MDRDIFWVLMVALVLGAFTCVGTCSVGCDRGYSQGERVGTVYKFSKRGLAWKTWEGEMNLGGVQSDGVANIWQFTVVDERLVPAVQRAMDSAERVKIGYVQWLMAPVPRSESGYEAVSVTPVPKRSPE